MQQQGCGILTDAQDCIECPQVWYVCEDLIEANPHRCHTPLRIATAKGRPSQARKATTPAYSTCSHTAEGRPPGALTATACPPSVLVRCSGKASIRYRTG